MDATGRHEQRRLTRRRCGRVLAALGIAGLATSLPVDLAGATTSASVAVTAGSLTISAPATVSFGTVTLNGTNQVPTASLAVDVRDATGSGSGWQLQGTSTTFTNGTNTLPTSATTIPTSGSITDACDASSTCLVATTTGLTFPYTLPAAATAPTASTFYDANTNTGMGDQTVTATVDLTIPANAYAGSYTSTWTVSIVSGP